MREVFRDVAALTPSAGRRYSLPVPRGCPLLGGQNAPDSTFHRARTEKMRQNMKNGKDMRLFTEKIRYAARLSSSGPFPAARSERGICAIFFDEGHEKLFWQCPA
jgi:hypothetical protein